MAVAGGITWYDVLGVTAGASLDTLKDAYSQRVAQLRPELLTGAPSPVVSAARRASEAVEAAWLVLSDPSRRHRYDKEIGLHRGHGLRGSPVFGGSDGAPASGQDPFYLLRDGLTDIGDDTAGIAFGALATWVTPLPEPARRRLIVPDVRGLFYRPCRDVATMAGLRLAVVQLTADAMPVEGLVVGQSPDPGSQVRRLSTLTVQVWHPPRR